jgi:hypothetical protein
VYARHREVEGKSVTTWVTTYVDDIWTFSQSGSEVESVIESIQESFVTTPCEWLCGRPGDSEWRVRDPNTRCSFLAHEIYWDSSDCLVLDQSRFINNAVVKLCEKGVASFSHMPEGAFSLRSEKFNQLWLNEEAAGNDLLTPVELTLLRSVVNTLSYVSSGTRVDLAAPVGELSRGQAGGRKRHLEAASDLVKYAWSTRGYVQRHRVCPKRVESWQGVEVHLSSFFDASFGSVGNGHARHGCALLVSLSREDGMCFLSKSGLQTTVATSTCEAELTCCSWCSKLLMGSANFLREVAPGIRVRLPMVMLGDSSAANLIANSATGLRAVRHLALQCLYVRELAQGGSILVRYVRSALNRADVLTKVMSGQQLGPLLRLWGLGP